MRMPHAHATCTCYMHRCVVASQLSRSVAIVHLGRSGEFYDGAYSASRPFGGPSPLLVRGMRIPRWCGERQCGPQENSTQPLTPSVNDTASAIAATSRLVRGHGHATALPSPSSSAAVAPGDAGRIGSGGSVGHGSGEHGSGGSDHGDGHSDRGSDLFLGAATGLPAADVLRLARALAHYSPRSHLALFVRDADRPRLALLLRACGVAQASRAVHPCAVCAHVHVQMCPLTDTCAYDAHADVETHTCAVHEGITTTLRTLHYLAFHTLLFILHYSLFTLSSRRDLRFSSAPTPTSAMARQRPPPPPCPASILPRLCVRARGWSTTSAASDSTTSPQYARARAHHPCLSPRQPSTRQRVQITRARLVVP